MSDNNAISEPDPLEDSKPTVGSDKQREFICGVCQKSSRTKLLLYQHSFTHTKPFKCEECGKSFAGKRQLKNHVTNNTCTKPNVEREFICGFCNICFRTKVEWHRHTLTHTKPLKCEVCSKGFARKDDLKNHMASHSGIKLYNCDMCGKSYSCVSNLRRHKLIHTGEVMVECTICVQKFANKITLEQHNARFHGGDAKILKKLPYKKNDCICKFCSQQFKTSMEKSLHIKKEHPSEVPFLCQFCDEGFMKKPNLEQHEKIKHRQEKTHKCDLCEKAFSYRYMLVDHVSKVHPDEVLIKCFHCSEIFDNTEDRTKHMEETHPYIRSSCKKNLDLYNGEAKIAEKTRICEFCSKRFRFQSELNAHLRIHTGEKPHKCSVCGKSFVQKSQLNCHMLSHTGERLFSCDICSKSFALPGNLRAHKKIHSVEKPLMCVVCNQAFDNPESLKNHLEQHNDAAN